MSEQEQATTVDQHGLPTPTKQQKKYMYVMYIAYAVGIFLPLGMLVSVIVAYAKRGEMKGTVYESHANFLIRTFWTIFILYFIGFITLFVIVGGFILLLAFIWNVVRLVSGLLKFLDAKPARNGWMMA